MSGSTLATKDATDPLIHKAYLAQLADAYAPPSIDRRDPLISPLFADLVGFPPMLIQSDRPRLCSWTRRGLPRPQARPMSM